MQVAIKKILGEDGKVSKQQLQKLQEQFPGLSDEIQRSAQKGVFDYTTFGALIDEKLADPQEKSNLLQRQLYKIEGTQGKKGLKAYAEQLSKQEEFIKYQDELKKAIEADDPALALSQILSKVSTSFDLSAKLTKDAIEASDVAAAKRAGLAMLQQTKSTEDALNKSIAKILRDIFRVIEKLTNMFAFINKQSLVDFNTINERTEKNRKSAEMSLDSLSGQKSTLEYEIARLEQEPLPENDEERKTREMQISSLKEQKQKVDEAIKSFEGLIGSIQNVTDVLAKEGKITKDVNNALLQTKEEAYKASYHGSVVNEGASIFSSQKGYLGEIGNRFEPTKMSYEQSYLKKRMFSSEYKLQNPGSAPEAITETYYDPFQKFLENQKGGSELYTPEIKIGKGSTSVDFLGSPTITSKSTKGNYSGDNVLTFQGDSSVVIQKALTDSDAFGMMSKKQQEAWKNLGEDQQRSVLSSITKDATNDPQLFQQQVSSAFKNLGLQGFSKGGIVPGNSFSGDKILARVNSGEFIMPPQMLANFLQPNINKNPASTKTNSKVINDNRVINIHVNQNDRRQIEQIVLNAIYSDKM